MIIIASIAMSVAMSVAMSALEKDIINTTVINYIAQYSV